MLTKASINRLFTRYTRWSAWFLRHKQTETGVAFLRLAAYVGYTFNLKYTDEALEDSLEHLSRSFTKDPVRIHPKPNSVVFYDSFSMDNRGLTQQYLHALAQLGYTIHYMVPHGTIGPDIKHLLETTPGATITCLTHTRFRENLEAGLKAIRAAGPSIVFQHLAPDDILGCCLHQPLTGCTRYRINLTDHAFWVGTRCSDYWIEFRRYGAWLSHHHRKLPLERLLLQPYYPIAVEKPFEGFPKTVQLGKTLLFAGATYYKLYGNNHRFLHLIRKVLVAHPNTQFLLAGDGNDAPLHTFIRQYKLENRIILLGSRRDITEVFRHIDIYINTYPMIGGLMSQLAAVCHKPIIGYTDEALYSFNDTEDLMGLPSTGALVVANETDFLYRMHRLITDTAYRNEMADYARKTLPTPDTFTRQLEQLLNTHTPQANNKQANNEQPNNKPANNKPATIQLNNIRVDLDTVTDVYIDMENHYQHQRNYLERIKPLKILFHQWLKLDLKTSLSHLPAYIRLKKAYRQHRFNASLKQNRNAQEKTLQAVQQKDTYTAVFLLIQASVWKYEGLYDLMKQDQQFKPLVVVCPYTQYGHDVMMDTMDQAVQTFQQKGYAVMPAYDKKTGTWLDIQHELKPDLVFFTNPYSLTAPNYSIDHFNGSLTFYVPYGYMITDRPEMQYNQRLHNLVYRIFHESTFHQHQAQTHALNKGINSVVTGYPGLDCFIHPSAQPSTKTTWKLADEGVKRIIWAPHHSIEPEDAPYNYSNFLAYADYFLDLAATHQDTLMLAFKPHPILKAKLYEHPEWGEERTNAYYQAWEKRPNCQLNEGDYVDLFLTSHAMIHDSGSFMVEYISTNKPSLYMVRHASVLTGFSALGNEIVDCHYPSRSKQDIEAFITHVVLGGEDPLHTKRASVINTYLTPPFGKSASQNSMDVLKNLLNEH